MPFMEVRKCQVDKQFIMQICAIYLIHDETAQVANLVLLVLCACMVVRHHAGTHTKLMVIV